MAYFAKFSFSRLHQLQQMQLNCVNGYISQWIYNGYSKAAELYRDIILPLCSKLANIFYPSPLLLVCLTPYNFTRRGRVSGWERVKLRPRSSIKKQKSSRDLWFIKTTGDLPAFQEQFTIHLWSFFSIQRKSNLRDEFWGSDELVDEGHNVGWFCCQIG